MKKSILINSLSNIFKLCDFLIKDSGNIRECNYTAVYKCFILENINNHIDKKKQETINTSLFYHDFTCHLQK